MDRLEKMDCRANGRVFNSTIGFSILNSLGYLDPYALLRLFQQKEMGYAIKSFNSRTTDRRYPMLPAGITNVHQAFKEIKHMAIDTWQEECRLAARRAMKEVLSVRDILY